MNLIQGRLCSAINIVHKDQAKKKNKIFENETLHYSILKAEGPLRIQVYIKLEWGGGIDAEAFNNKNDTIEKGAVKKFKRNTALIRRYKHPIFPSCNLICT